MLEPIQQISDTAFMAAAYRAQESTRPDALFRDPLAARLCGDKGRAVIAKLPPRAMVGGWSVVIRTHVIDQIIAAAVADGVDTVLNLGAGLDTRPYRLALPRELRWIEVDVPQVMAGKTRQLEGEAPHCEVLRLGVDLRDALARRAALVKATVAAKRVLVLTEAVTPYLTEQDVAELARDLRAIPAVVAWINDYFSPDAYAYRRRSGMSQAMQNAPFLFEPADYFVFFAACGWRADETRYFAPEAKALGRPAPFPWWLRAINHILLRLASQPQRQAMQSYAGISRLVPVQTEAA